MAPINFVNIELKLPEETITIPYDDKTKDICLCDGIWIFGNLYRIQGQGGRRQDDGNYVRTLKASTLEFFNQTTSAKVIKPAYIVHDLDSMLNAGGRI